MNQLLKNTKSSEFVFVIMLCLVATSSFSQTISPNITLDSLYSKRTLDSLSLLNGYGKTIPNSYEYHVLLALSYYPELDSSRVVFKEQKIKTTMNTRPTFWSIFAKKRKYVIRINKNEKHPILLKDVPFNASIGLLSHEFAHILDYRSRSFFGIFKRGIDYTSRKRKTNFEKEIDSIVIEKGLGWQLYDWSYYVLNLSKASEKYKAFKRQTYLTPEEIKEIMKRYANYRL